MEVSFFWEKLGWEVVVWKELGVLVCVCVSWQTTSRETGPGSSVQAGGPAGTTRPGCW